LLRQAHNASKQKRPDCKTLPHQSWYPQAETDTTPPVPGAPDTTAIAVFVALDGTQGVKTISVTPKPLAFGAVHWVKFMVAVMTPVTVALLVNAAVALARIENPQM
jgi:hypothetical protein